MNLQYTEDKGEDKQYFVVDVQFAKRNVGDTKILFDYVELQK